MNFSMSDSVTVNRESRGIWSADPVQFCSHRNTSRDTAVEVWLRGCTNTTTRLFTTRLAFPEVDTSEKQ